MTTETKETKEVNLPETQQPVQTSTPPKTTAIKQILFDCDNTLVLSETVAFEAVTPCVNEFLAYYGINKKYIPDELLAEFMGLTFKAMMRELEKKHNLTVTDEDYKMFVKKEEDAVQVILAKKATPCEGSMEVLEMLHKEKKYGLAVVSSSAMGRILSALRRTNQLPYFPESTHIFSAVSSLPVPTPKPDPAVYLHAMKALGVTAEETVAVEDSRSGARSAVGAGIRCIAYVGAYFGLAQKEVGRTLTEEGCVAVIRHWSELPEALRVLEGGRG